MTTRPSGGGDEAVGLEGVRVDDAGGGVAGIAEIDMAALQQVFDKGAGGVFAVGRGRGADSENGARDCKTARIGGRAHQ